MNAQKDAIVKSGFYSVLQIIIASFAYVSIYFLVISKLGRDQLGVWSMITALPTVVAFLGTGVSSSLIKFIPTYQGNNKVNQVNNLITSGFLFNLLLGFLIIIPAILFKSAILKLMLGIGVVPNLYYTYFCYALATFFINFLSSVFLSSLDGLQKIPLKNKILIASSILFCLSSYLFIFKFGLQGLFYAQLLQAVIVLILSLFALNLTNAYRLRYAHLDLNLLRIFYFYGSKFQYISILNLFFEPITKYFVNRYFGIGSVGTFDIVNRILGQIRSLIVNAIQVIVPFVAKQLDQHKFTLLIYQKSLQGALLLSFILFGVVLTAGFSVIYFFNKIKVDEFQSMLVCLSFAYMVNILSTPAYSMRLATGRLNYLLIAQLLSTGLNVLFFLILGRYSYSTFVLMPTALAISISSLYIILSFKTITYESLWNIIKTDKYVYFFSIVFPLVCALLAFYKSNPVLLLAFALLHVLTMLWLVYKNEFLMDIISTLIKKKKLHHE